jgi:hypothetical protein
MAETHHDFIFHLLKEDELFQVSDKRERGFFPGITPEQEEDEGNEVWQ